MSARIMNKILPDFSDVIDAAEHVDGVVARTPLLRSDVLDEHVGRQVYVKCECLQQTGSFKLRGAYNRLSRFSEAEAAKGAVAFSSGNHAQGVARAARMLGIPATIVMPSDTPGVKVQGVLHDGADIVFYDRFTESREEIAARLAAEKGAIVVPSYDDFHVIAGQGTCGLEITEQWPLDIPPEALVCCVGGGGLIAGVSLAVRHVWPSIKVWGAEPEDFDDHARSLKSGLRETNDPSSRSICDALLSPSPGELTFAINQPVLSGIARVSDEDARNAVRFAARHLKLVAEPGGAAALAGLLSGHVSFDGDGPVIVIITGGNIDPSALSEILSAANEL